ncbi:MAG: hypothetical protein HFI46_15410 [Lachnospiraceae bacterium]|nr:hypothetical protein [Lachnospiraceae bacterium]
MGRPDFEAVHETDDDPEFFCQAMGTKRIPSPEILRQRMDGIGREVIALYHAHGESES